MNSLKPRERALIVLCVVVVAVGVWLRLSRPRQSEAALLPTAKARADAEVARRTVTRMQREQEERAPQIARMAYTRSPEQVIPRVINTLQGIAERSGVHIREIKPQRPREIEGTDAAKISLEINFTAAFQPQVMRFLYHVEDPAGRMVVEKFDIASANSRLKTVEVTALVSVFTRHQAEEANPETLSENAVSTANRS